VSGTEGMLTGTVASCDQRRRAERVSGVSHVQNNVRVKDLDDSSVTTAGNT
jgi:osmotically-inducible protein OsmY